ncbi:hypothetical protein SAMN05192534_102167 [Alteribacillus persepolensis]|uniref:PDZ domain-containing protein n=1 Tax=Alteribacillus persepolensis TaxID=568899 RepID=A0A1G8AHS0_9BACI|nr:PDZ domain-containing protein [Alteribacillus persepolensis]SDH20502.1 hypothetical protein SAMN05192534_102167 [Alteribacillus persepolensis]
MIDFGFELLKGIGRLFAHPLTYFIPFIMFLMGVMRVKRERHAFHTSVRGALFDVTVPLLPGVLAGICLSVFILVAGVTVPAAFVHLVGVITAVFLLFGRIRWLSPSYTIGLAMILAFFLPSFESDYTWLDEFFTELGQGDYRPVVVLLAVTLFIEGILLLKDGKRHTSPLIVKSSRGKWIGAHLLQRIWFIPAFFVVPGSAVEAVNWWPVIPVNESGFALFLIPFVIGAKQRMFYALPAQTLQPVGKFVILLSLFIAVCAVFAYYEPLIIMYAAVVAMLFRSILMLWSRRQEQNHPPLFALRERGIRILGILPESPAEKMALQPGEIIMKVNGQEVNNEAEFYQALQKNSAYCKLEVEDEQGEVRHTQSTVYDNEHYELGLLFVKEEEEIVTTMEA